MTSRTLLVLALVGVCRVARAEPTMTSPTVPPPTASPTPAPRPRYPLVPWPAHLQPADGAFTLGAETAITLSDPKSAELREIATQLQDSVALATGKRLAIAEEKPPKAQAAAGMIALVLQKAPGKGAAAIAPEGYTLSVTTKGATIKAPQASGVFYGMQTLVQLLPRGADAPAGIPAVEIQDEPRFRYRGLHLDVGRHLFPVEFIKRYIDTLASYKLNTFHWHLTDDQGWRIEIKRYPKLTEIGSKRAETVVDHRRTMPRRFDGTPYGGFYTQDQVRDIVAYAKARYVTVIPEIEMPGHAKAAIAAYPELACTPGPFEVGTNWGIYEDIFCPKEETFEFLQNVLTEVMDLFPSEYIHIGGDEAPKKRWMESEIAQDVMRREGLADANALQSFFMKRIEKFVNSRGRKIIGWDEIAEGGLSPTATVMYWRDRKEAGVGVALDQDPMRFATSHGNDVIMTPSGSFYFDYYQFDPTKEGQPLAAGRLTTLDMVYAYDPIPADLTPEQAKHIIGAQGNVWTEYMKTTDYVEYMAYPRAMALAEVVWSPKAARDFASFVARARINLRMLDERNVRYRMP
jgi:hexosaminidase